MWKVKSRCADSDKYTKYLLIILLVSLVYAAYHIWVSGYHVMDMDYAALMLWPKLIFERGLFSTGFRGSTENPLTALGFIPQIIVHVLGFSWLAAIKIAAMFNTALFILLFFLLMRRLGLSLNAALISCIFLINTYFSHYSIFYELNIYHSNLYAIILIVLILALDVYQAKESKKKKILFMAASFVAGAVSMRAFFLILAPLFVMEFIKMALRFRGQNELPVHFLRTIKQENRGFYLAFIACVLGGIGSVGAALIGRFMGLFGGYPMDVQSFEEILKTLPQTLSQGATLLGFPRESLTISSINDLLVLTETLLRVAVFSIFLIVFIHIWRVRKDSILTNKLKWIVCFFSISISMNFLLIMVVFAAGARSRHQFITWYLVAVLAAAVMDKAVVATKIYRVFSGVIMAMLCIISFYNNSVVVTNHYRQADPPPRMEAAQYLLDSGYDVVLGRNAQDSYVMGGYTDLELQTAAFSTDFAPHLWLVDTHIFHENKGKYAIIFSDEAREKELLETFLESSQAKIQLIMSEARFDRKFGPLNIYSLDYNPTLDVRVQP